MNDRIILVGIGLCAFAYIIGVVIKQIHANETCSKCGKNLGTGGPKKEEDNKDVSSSKDS
jgi:hypothetical protein